MDNEKMKFIPAVNQFIDKIKSDDDLKDIDIDIIKKNINVYIKQLKCPSSNLSFGTNDTTIPLEDLKNEVLNHFLAYIKQLTTCPLKPVINATGIVIHTNLGRAPMSDFAFDKLRNNNAEYTNIELDLLTGKRAYRDDYLRDIFHFITGSEDVVVVNNNAAALYLILKSYVPNVGNALVRSDSVENALVRSDSVGNALIPCDNEIIISRGELIEIGGSFRIPDILQSAGAVLKEVGTTNCTRISDYEKAINKNTALILKAHTSNYTIKGYTESPSIDELVDLAKRYDIPFVYDAGSGLIKKPKLLKNTDELTISECIEKGVDIICFSGDKLIGASQAGIILGKKDLLKPMKKNPLMRVLRADKLTIANLYNHISMYKSEKMLLENNKVYALLSQSDDELINKAKLLSKMLFDYNIKNKIKETPAYTGGGSFPDIDLKSYEIQIDLNKKNISQAELYHKLMSLEIPIVTILRERKVYINIFTIDKEDINYIAESTANIVNS